MKNLTHLYVLLFISCSCFSLTAQKINNPVAGFQSVVVSGNAAFTVLTPELIRLEWSQDAKFQDLASLIFINRNLTVPRFKKEQKSGWLIIKTEKLTLKYKQNSGKFTRDNLVISMFLNGKAITWHPGDVDSLNLLGTTRTLDGARGDSFGSNKVELEKGIVSRGGWTLLNDTTNLFDGNKQWDWITTRSEKNFQDWYFFGYGHNYTKALYDYTQIAGKIPMPPRFAFGYWWCRYWSYSDSEMKNVVNSIKENNIPIDVAIIDMDWHRTDGLSSSHGWYKMPKDIMGQTKGWTGYTWNNELFPNPVKFLEWMDNKNIKNALNLHPSSGILPNEEGYPRMVKALGLDTTKDTPYDHQFAKQAGWDTISVGKAIPWDITSKKFAQAYFNEIIHPLENQGIDFFWLDWQQWTNTPIKGLNNTWWLNYCFYTDMERNSKNRPLLFHRWGGLGNHRYQIGFSGDTFSSWSSLNYQKSFTSTAANVGYGYWSHDIGGHMLTSEYSPELYTRWIQYGTFSPILRTHATKDPKSERRIWAYPYDYFVQMKKAIQLRYALLPYIYTAAHTTYETGLSICLPMYYKHPENNEAYQFKDQYYFGNDMIVSPVSDSIQSNTKLAKVKVWLPGGKWFDYFTGETLSGDKEYNRSYSLAQIPVFIKAGSIIPMYPPMPNTQHLPDTLILTVIPGEKGNMQYYEDAGNDKEYTKGNYSTINAEQTTSNNMIIVKINKPAGTYPAHIKAYRVDLCNTLPPVTASVNGRKLAWSYDPVNLTTSVFVDAIDPDTNYSVSIEFKDNLASTYALLNGIKGQMEAFNEISPKLKEALGSVEIGPMSSVINNLAQTSTRIEYNTEFAKDEYISFTIGFRQIENEINKMNLKKAKVLPLINRVKNCLISEPVTLKK